MISECKACTCAARWYFKFINNFFPKFEGADTLVATSYNYCLEKLTEVKFSSADRRHFKVVVSDELLLESNYTISKLNTLSLLVIWVKELKLRR